MSFPEFESIPSCGVSAKPVTSCGCSSCCDQAEEYAKVKITRTCAQLGSSSEASAVEGKKEDQTFDYITQQAVVSSIGDNFNVLVNNSNLYSVGQWIEFIGPYGAYRIVGVQDGILTLRNACQDGAGEIPGNPGPGASFPVNTRFVTSVSVPCESDNEARLETLKHISSSDEICLDAISEQEDGHLRDILSVGFEDASGTPQRPCLGKTKAQGPKVGQRSFHFPDSAVTGTTPLNRQSLIAILDGEELKFRRLFNHLTPNQSLVLNGNGELESQDQYRRWILKNEVHLVGDSSSSGSSGTGQKTYPLSNIPDGATHVTLSMLSYASDTGSNYTVKDKNGNVLLRWFSGGGSTSDDDHSASSYVSAPLTGSSVELSINGVQLRYLSVVGYERITEI